MIKDITDEKLLEFSGIWESVMDKKITEVTSTSAMEKHLCIQFVKGKMSESEVRSLLAKIKLFNES